MKAFGNHAVLDNASKNALLMLAVITLLKDNQPWECQQG